MDKKLIVTLLKPEDKEAVGNTGCEILADYPDSLLVRCTEAQQNALKQAGLEVAELKQPPIHISGASFSFTNALKAERAAPVAPGPNRKAYYLIQLIGPAKGEWLDKVRALGGVIHGDLPSFTLLVGMMPNVVRELENQPWVEAITPYRPAMKISAKLRPDVSRELSTAELASVKPVSAEPKERKQVEISVFPGESTTAIAEQIRAGGGTVLKETPQAIVAVIAPGMISDLANEQSVQSILPHKFPKFSNDVATGVMGAPADRVFGSLTLQGTNQIVAVADSGLDTGNAAAIHADFAGRIVNIVSFPTNSDYATYTNDPPSHNDGPADTDSGHGTHVAGSVLSNGAAAIAAGSALVPQGTAPEARIYFQAVEQRVNWKTAAELGFPPGADWPPDAISLWGLPSNLNDLFNPAYTAGARIHTNSWGAPSSGEYTDDSRAVDQFMWDHRDMLILFAAGNEGVDANGNGIIDLDSINSPSTAKNCLTVGASENNRPHGSLPPPGLDINWSAWDWPQLGPAGHVSDNMNGMAAFSSRGPTDDVRIKPDVTAPGTNVLSTKSSVAAGSLWGRLPAGHILRQLYWWSGGTSMSTPLVAGAAALIRQHLVQHRGHFVDGVKPSGALIKAFLINGAVAMAGQFPNEIPPGRNNVSGFGRVNLTESLTPGILGQTLFADEPDYAVETGQMRTFEVQAIDVAMPLKVTLVWTDAPSPANVGGLRNKLYLQVRRPDSTIVNGDTTAYPTVTNNVQQVVIDPPAAGTYEIRVRGVSVTQQAPGASAGTNPRQDFALVVSNGMGMSMQPVSIAQAIDTTGSMDYFGYMVPAKERATQLLDFMRINDKVSITEFSQRTGIPNDARTPYSMHLLGSVNPDWTNARTAIAGLLSDGFTPIGAGLQEAWNQLHLEPNTRPRAIVLLSDGLNNRPPDPFTVLPAIPADVPIFAIALGPAGSAPTLQNIASSRPNGSYYVVASDEDIHFLHSIYAQVQALAARVAIAGLSSAAVGSGKKANYKMNVEPGAKEATFTLSWEKSAGLKQMELTVVGPDGNTYNCNSAATLERKGNTYHLVRVAVPKPGEWSLQVYNTGSEEPVKHTVSTAVQSPLKLVVEPLKVGDRYLTLIVRLLRGNVPWDDARITARFTMPTRSRKQILDEFGDRIRDIQLPKTVDEPGLTQEQVLDLKIAVFAQQFSSDSSGFYRRQSLDVEMFPKGDGTWSAEIPIPTSGNSTVEIFAQGEIDGVTWERHASQSVHVPEAAAPARKLQITDIFVRRNIFWSYRIIGARVAFDDGTLAKPGDGVTVSMTLGQKTKKASSGNLPYQSSGKYYIWRFGMSGFRTGNANLTVQAKLGGVVVATASQVIRL